MRSFSERWLIFLFSSLLFASPALAQKQGQQLIDSLLNELPKIKEDTNKVILLNKLSFVYESIDPDKGIRYGTMAIELAGQIKWTKGIARAHNVLGGNFSIKSDFPRAMDHYLKALAINEELGNKQDIANNSVNIGIIYYSQRDYHKALEYYLKALAFNETSDNKLKLADNLVNIGNVYSILADYPKAMEYYQRSLAIDEQIKNRQGVAQIYSNIGDDYFTQKDYSSALRYDEMSLGIYQALGDKDGIAANFGAIGSTYLATVKGKGANGDNEGTTAELNKAIEYLDKGLIISKEIGNLSYVMQFSRDISEAYMLSGDCNNALSNLLLSNKLKDSVFSDENKIKIAELEKQREKSLNDKLVKLQLSKARNERISIGLVILLLLIVIGIVIRNSRRVTREKERSDELLLNILPAKIADELKTTGKAEARYFEQTTVIFTDFVDFTIATERMSPHELITELDHCFKTFDSILEKYKIEKIKTAGDAYIAVSGLPTPNNDHATEVIKAAIEIRQFMLNRRRQFGVRTFEVRIGVHSGSVVAGIVGHKKFAYDIWGDTVNTAARMEQNSEPGKINISETTYELVKDAYACTYRGEIVAKNKGLLRMYYVNTIG